MYVMYVCIYEYVYMNVCMCGAHLLYLCMYVCMYVWYVTLLIFEVFCYIMFFCWYKIAKVCIHTYICVWMYVCMYVCVYSSLYRVLRYLRLV